MAGVVAVVVVDFAPNPPKAVGVAVADTGRFAEDRLPKLKPSFWSSGFLEPFEAFFVSVVKLAGLAVENEAKP